MDPRLAKGHATQFILSHPDSVTISNWCESDRYFLAEQAFIKSTFSKKPGHIIRRVKKHLSPLFNDLKIINWEKYKKSLYATQISSTYDTRVFRNFEDKHTAYGEKSLLYSSIIMSVKNHYPAFQLHILTNISHHTISRLLEREASTLETLNEDIKNIFNITDMLQTFLSSEPAFHAMPNIDLTQKFSILLPYKDGALVLKPMKINPSAKTPNMNQKLHVLSVRTFLAPSMLTPEDHERMGGYDTLLTTPCIETGAKQILSWLKGNIQQDPQLGSVSELA